jgi:uncharacterized protein
MEDKSMQVPTIERSDRKRRYELRVGSDVIGFSQYRDDAGRRVFIHTEIEPDYQGHGLATQLIEWALNDTRTAGMRIGATCPTVVAYLAKNHEFDDLLDDVVD